MRIQIKLFIYKWKMLSIIHITFGKDFQQILSSSQPFYK